MNGRRARLQSDFLSSLWRLCRCSPAAGHPSHTRPAVGRVIGCICVQVGTKLDADAFKEGGQLPLWEWSAGAVPELQRAILADRPDVARSPSRPGDECDLAGESLVLVCRRPSGSELCATRKAARLGGEEGAPRRFQRERASERLQRTDWERRKPRSRDARE